MSSKLYNLMDWPEIEGVVYSECSNPFDILGGHICKEGFLIQAFRPDAKEMYVEAEGKKKRYRMENVDDAGYFAAIIPSKKEISYKLIVERADKESIEYIDPYAYGCQLSDKDVKKFNSGTACNAYEFMGSHRMKIDGVEGVHFAVWAPNARRVSVVGEFNRWDGRIYQMHNNNNSGIFELFIPNIDTDKTYCYEIKFKNGSIVRKCDPYATRVKQEVRYSAVMDKKDNYKWTDKQWEKSFVKAAPSDALAICELNLENIMDDCIVSRVKELGFNYVIFKTVAATIDGRDTGEISNYFALHMSYDDLDVVQKRINDFHNNGIAVIMDWNIAYIGQAACGLIYFDGVKEYELNTVRLERQQELEVSAFDYSKPQVRTLLYSNLMYWLKKFHFDGFRINELASMLYLDYGKMAGEWIPNIYGGNENLEAVEFLKGLNRLVEKCDKVPLIIAEDHSLWARVTAAVKDDGLGIDFKQNDGWKSELAAFMELDPLFRKGSYDKLTYGMLYQYSDNFILDLSRVADEWRKRPLLERMPEYQGEQGIQYTKTDNLKAALVYMYTHPGKKLINIEDTECCEKFVAELNRLYFDKDALYSLDDKADGFYWLDNTSAQETVLAYMRSSVNGSILISVLNFTPVERTDFRIKVPKQGKYRVIFDSTLKDDKMQEVAVYESQKDYQEDGEEVIFIKLQALAGVICEYEPYTELELERIQIKREAQAAQKEADEEARSAEQLKQEAIEKARLAKEAKEKADIAAKEALEAQREAETRAELARKNSEMIAKVAEQKLAELEKKIK